MLAQEGLNFKLFIKATVKIHSISHYYDALENIFVNLEEEEQWEADRGRRGQINL